MLRWRAVLTMGCLLLLAAVMAEAGNSGGYRGPTRNGVYPAKGLIRQWPEDGLKLLWKYDELGPGWASATVVDDTVYCIGGAPQGHLYALTLDGKLKWRQRYGVEFTSRFDGTRSTPTVSDGMVYFSSGKKDERSIYCHDAETGEQIWHVDGNKRYGGKSQGWGYNESPLVYEDKVIFTLRAKDDQTPSLVALDKKTGETAWEAEKGNLSAGDCSVSLAGEGEHQVLIAHTWNAVMALDPDTGKTLWKIPIKSGTILTPLYRDGYLCLGMKTNANGKKHNIAMLKLSEDSRSYEQLWTKGVNDISQVVMVDGKLFGIGGMQKTVADKNGKEKRVNVPAFVCYDVKTGELLKAVECMSDGSVVAADGMVFIVEGGERHWKEPKMSCLLPTKDGFEVVGRFQPVVGSKELWVSPTIAEDRLFIRHGSSLICYDLRPASYAKKN